MISLLNHAATIATAAGSFAPQGFSGGINTLTESLNGTRRLRGGRHWRLCYIFIIRGSIEKRYGSLNTFEGVFRNIIHWIMCNIHSLIAYELCNFTFPDKKRTARKNSDSSSKKLCYVV